MIESFGLEIRAGTAVAPRSWIQAISIRIRYIIIFISSVFEEVE